MIKLLDNNYSVERGKEFFDLEEVKSYFTDYFSPYDYVLGDYSYDKLRLKGFYNKDNKSVSDINNIAKLDEYIEKYCAYGAKIFLLKKKK